MGGFFFIMRLLQIVAGHAINLFPENQTNINNLSFKHLKVSGLLLILFSIIRMKTVHKITLKYAAYRLYSKKLNLILS
jgi:hypothetical protein